jgi:hypothetical protein
LPKRLAANAGKNGPLKGGTLSEAAGCTQGILAPDGMDTLLVREVNDNAIELSGGEKQKLALARALYKDAPIIILDEPTAALDPIAENEVYRQYAELTKGKPRFTYPTDCQHAPSRQSAFPQRPQNNRRGYARRAYQKGRQVRRDVRDPSQLLSRPGGGDKHE